MTKKIALYFHHATSCPAMTQLIEDFKKIDGEKIVFFNDGLGIEADGFALMHGKNLYYYDGAILATCVNTAQYVRKCPVIKEKYFFFNGDTASQPKPAKEMLDLLKNINVWTTPDVAKNLNGVFEPVTVELIEELFNVN